MSNRPSRKRSRSASAGAATKGKSRTTGRRRGPSRRAGLVGLAIVGVVAVTAIVLAIRLRDANTTNEPVLDAQATQGQQVAKQKGCISCHTSDGHRSEGPTWKGLYGSTVTLTDGSKVTADDAYLTQAIRQPGAQIVSGFSSGMPTTPVTDDELAALLAYIKALG